jgi:hypothetical protein
MELTALLGQTAERAAAVAVLVRLVVPDLGTQVGRVVLDQRHP